MIKILSVARLNEKTILYGIFRTVIHRNVNSNNINNNNKNKSISNNDNKNKNINNNNKVSFKFSTFIYFFINFL